MESLPRPLGMRLAYNRRTSKEMVMGYLARILNAFGTVRDFHTMKVELGYRAHIALCEENYRSGPLLSPPDVGYPHP